MKMKLFYAFCFSGLSLISVAQNPINLNKSNIKKNEGSKTELKPEFKFLVQENTHDFGTIPEGPKAVYEFQFLNIGKAPLLITNAQASCGCTSPEFPREPILPGKKGKIKVTYTTEGHVGNFTKSVYLTSNAQVNDGNGHFELKITGIVLAKKK
jgi:hypothetical protein